MATELSEEIRIRLEAALRKPPDPPVFNPNEDIKRALDLLFLIQDSATDGVFIKENEVRLDELFNILIKQLK